MFRRGPLTFADDGQSGAVNDEVQAGARAGAPTREGEMLTASRERGVIGGREIDAQHPEDRGQEALGLTQRSVEDETERQGGFDGEIGILELPAPPADASRCPRGDRVRREPEGDVASPHEGSVVLGPVPDAIRCRVLRMHSRLHIEIMTRLRSRWSTCRPLLAHRAESAHQRRDVTVWVSSEAITAWTPRRSGHRGGQRRYSDLAIETALTLRLLYHLPLRQAEGFLHALFGIMRLDLSVPDYTTLSRRSKHLRRCLRPVPPGEGLHLVLDSTGLSIVGAGEWAAATHGGRGRRGWRKLHRGVDQSGVIRVHTLTEATGEDATTALDLLTAGEGPLVRVTADAASDTVAVYETATARGATVIIPPAKTANISGHGPRSPAQDRTVTVVKQLGRRRWKQVSGYHRQGRVENTFFRDTSIIGDGLRARSPAGQGREAVLGCEILNRMTALGRPVSYRIDR